MVHTYKRRLNRKSNGEELLQSAMKMVESGDLSKRQAMKQYGIPCSTTALRLKQGNFLPESVGRFKRVFDDEFERKLIKHMEEMPRAGF